MACIVFFPNVVTMDLNLLTYNNKHQNKLIEN